MKPMYVRLMDWLYWTCITVGVVSIVIMTVLVFAGAMARDLLGFGAMYSEQLSIMLAIQMAFYGAAACYRAHAHLSLMLFVGFLPKAAQLTIRRTIPFLFVAIGAAMIYWGVDLVRTTMFQHYAEFPWEGLKVGYIYTAVPISGAITILFAIEQILYFTSSEAFHGDTEAGSETEADIIRRAREGHV